MISESSYWKDELYKNYQTLVRFINLKRRDERSFIKAEKAIMMSAYIIRKLNEAEKIPPDFLKDSICLSEYSAINMHIDKFNSHHIDRNYNLSESKKHNDKIEFFIDQIIHSFVFFFIIDEGNNDFSILFNSDKTKKDSLFEISFEKIFEIILRISEGNISESHICFDEKRGERKLTKAKYSYPKDFDLKKIVRKSLRGKIYKRDKNVEFDMPIVSLKQIEDMQNGKDIELC